MGSEVIVLEKLMHRTVPHILNLYKCLPMTKFFSMKSNILQIGFSLCVS